MDRSWAVGAPPESLGRIIGISLPASSQTAKPIIARPIRTVANGRYLVTEAISGDTASPKSPNTVTNPADIATVAAPARAKAAGRDGASLLPAITSPR